MIRKKILIATGGTGGHTIPAYSLAKNLLNKNFNVRLTSDKRGFKYLQNFEELHLIKIFSSPLLKKNVFTLLFSLLKIFFSIIQSLIFLVFSRPLIVFGMGGYASFPICIASSILRIKFVIYENNLIIGKANKFLLPFAEKIFVSYKEVEGVPNKYKTKLVVIGNLIREEIIFSKSEIKNNDKFDEIKILVIGGSQAARVFAEELPQVFKRCKELGKPIKIFQQCQKNQNTQLAKFYDDAKIDYELFNYTDKIIEYYLNTNLIITRSGASVLGEIINLKIPFIAIPLPSSADNHQYKNAEFYSKKGYGYLMEEKNIKNKLFDLIKLIFSDKSVTKRMLSYQKKHSDKEIFENLNVQIQKILDEKN